MGHRARGQEQEQRLPPCRGGEEEDYNSTQGQAGLSGVRLGQPQPFSRLCSSETTARLAAPPAGISQDWQTSPLPAFDLQPGGTQRPPPPSKCSGARGGHGALLITPRAALARRLSAKSSEGPEPDLAPSFPWAPGISSVGCCAWGGGRGEGSPPAQPGCDPRKFGVAPHRGRVAEGQAEMMDGTRHLEWSQQ